MIIDGKLILQHTKKVLTSSTPSWKDNVAKADQNWPVFVARKRQRRKVARVHGQEAGVAPRRLAIHRLFPLTVNPARGDPTPKRSRRGHCITVSPQANRETFEKNPNSMRRLYGGYCKHAASASARCARRISSSGPSWLAAHRAAQWLEARGVVGWAMSPANKGRRDPFWPSFIRRLRRAKDLIDLLFGNRTWRTRAEHFQTTPNPSNIMKKSSFFIVAALLGSAARHTVVGRRTHDRGAMPQTKHALTLDGAERSLRLLRLTRRQTAFAPSVAIVDEARKPALTFARARDKPERWRECSIGVMHCCAVQEATSFLQHDQ